MRRKDPKGSIITVQQAPLLISEFNKFYTLNIRRFSYKENSPPVTFYSFPDIPRLKELKLVNLNIQNLSDGIRYFEFLEKLDFSGNDFENLPEDMNRLPRLKTLWLRNCSKLKELPELPQVHSLTLSNCRNLRALVNLVDSSQDPTIYCLLELCLDNCKNMESLSEQLSHFTKLTFLDLSSHDFNTLPSSIRDLTSLVTLCINNCKKLISVKKLPLSLQFLDAHGCDSLEADALEHFKGRINREVPAQPRSACFQETEMPSYGQDHQETEMPSYKQDHQATKSRQGNLCNNCKQPGHFARDCSNVSVCNNCGLPGHIAAKCTAESRCWNCREPGHVASNCSNEGICNSCGKSGHRVRDCPNPDSRSGGLRLCNNCFKPGHLSADCTNDKACKNCRTSGHIARDCQNEPICNICSISGHVARQCPKGDTNYSDR